jgi:hypothetical protein
MNTEMDSYVALEKLQRSFSINQSLQTSIQKQNLGRPNFTGQAAIEKIYAPYEATLCSAHFHTLSKPLPSPVKNRPSGPT